MFDEFMSNETNAVTTTDLTNLTDVLGVLARHNNSDIKLYIKYIPQIIAVTRILPPIWWVIGIIGNTIALLVWLQPKMRHSSGYYLAALAITDLIFLPLSIVFEVNYTYSNPIVDKAVFCQWFAVTYMTVQHLSPVFVLAFTVERYLSVCHPFRMVNTNNTQNRTALLTILGLTLLILTINAPNGYFWTTEHEDGSGVCHFRGSSQLVWYYWTWVTEMLIFAAVPFTVLILNILVIVEVKKISRLEQRNMRTNSIDRRSTTVMLLGVSFYLIFTVLPVTIAHSLWQVFPMGNQTMTDEEVDNDPQWQTHITYAGARLLIQNIGQSHFSANFFIYLLTGKIFRKQLQEMIAVFCCKTNMKYFMPSHSSKGVSTRTTRMSLTSHRGSIGKSRLGSLFFSSKPTDPCNNDVETVNKNSMYSMAELETLDPSTHQGYNSGVHLPSKQLSPQARLLTCVEESDGGLSSDKEIINDPQPTLPEVKSEDKTRN